MAEIYRDYFFSSKQVCVLRSWIYLCDWGGPMVARD